MNDQIDHAEHAYWDRFREEEGEAEVAQVNDMMNLVCEAVMDTEESSQCTKEFPFVLKLFDRAGQYSHHSPQSTLEKAIDAGRSWILRGGSSAFVRFHTGEQVSVEALHGYRYV